MSDAYGSLIFSKSADCKVDLSILIQELNKLNWSNDGSEWLYAEENDSLRFNSRHPQYPVAIPEFVEVDDIYQKDGSFMTYIANAAEVSKFEEGSSMSYYPYSFKELSQRFSPHVKQGWIEIACCANEKARYVYFQSLRIHSNGRAVKRNVWSGPCINPIDEHESYEPGIELAI